MLKNLNLFQNDEHQPFYWPGKHPAALLIHGFPGTPAELRPLGRALNQTGWTVQGVLLPGFGSEIETLVERHRSEWVGAVESAVTSLQHEHDPLLIVGYSMGAALAMQVAVSHRPQGLILLAPFWQLGNWRQQLIGLLMRPFVRHVSPLKNADFSDPQVRDGIRNFLPHLDLDDPQVQTWLRELKIPITMFEQLHHLGQTAYNLAPQLSLPVLMIQGIQDDVARTSRTRRLLQRLPGPVHYAEVAAGHDLVSPECPAWPQIEHRVLDFARLLDD